MSHPIRKTEIYLSFRLDYLQESEDTPQYMSSTANMLFQVCFILHGSLSTLGL